MLSEELIIFLLILIPFLIFWVWISTYTSDIKSGTTIIKCAPGQCLVNVINGEKLCSDDPTLSLSGDPAYQICSSRYYCENPIAPYALQLDGSTNSSGVCPPNVACRCLPQAQCAYDQLVTFMKTENGFIQQGVMHQGYAGSTNAANIDNVSSFCAIKPYHLDTIGGGCVFKVFNEPTTKELIDCFKINPCLSGQLAFYPRNFEQFTYDPSETPYTIPVSCVPLVEESNSSVNLQYPCSDSDEEVPVWDSGTASIICVKST